MSVLGRPHRLLLCFNNDKCGNSRRTSQGPATSDLISFNLHNNPRKKALCISTEQQGKQGLKGLLTFLSPTARILGWFQSPLPSQWSQTVILNQSPQDVCLLEACVHIQKNTFVTGIIPRTPQSQTSFYCARQILRVLQIEGLWQPCVEHSHWHHFPSSICSLRICVTCW